MRTPRRSASKAVRRGGRSPVRPPSGDHGRAVVRAVDQIRIESRSPIPVAAMASRKKTSRSAPWVVLVVGLVDILLPPRVPGIASRDAMEGASISEARMQAAIPPFVGFPPSGPAGPAETEAMSRSWTGGGGRVSPLPCGDGLEHHRDAFSAPRFPRPARGEDGRLRRLGASAPLRLDRR